MANLTRSVTKGQYQGSPYNENIYGNYSEECRKSTERNERHTRPQFAGVENNAGSDEHRLYNLFEDLPQPAVTGY